MHTLTYTGGLVGGGSKATITNVFAICDTITAAGFGVASGLIGYGTDAAITNAYAVSNLVYGKTRAAGLIGYIGYGGSIITRNAYWDSNTSGILVGYGTPQTSRALRSSNSTSEIYKNWDNSGCGWDFGNHTEYPAPLL